MSRWWSSHLIVVLEKFFSRYAKKSIGNSIHNNKVSCICCVRSSEVDPESMII
ncbi:unnamed protein product, partial [Linum tenue]